MKANEGSIDRTLRVIAGLVIIGLGFFYGSWWGAIGIIPLVTGAIGWCPVYMPLGISTCRVKKPE